MDMADREAAFDADSCPRCGTALRFEDDDGTRECICGWSERTPDPMDDLQGIDDSSDEPLLI